MGGKGSSPPPAPNPQATAAASTSTNVSTAIANAFLNNTGQNTPDGSLRYDVTGNYNWVDPYTGTNLNIPTFTATQTLSPQQQAIQDQTNAAKFNLAGLANNQSTRLSDLLSNEINLGGAPGAADPNSLASVPSAQTTFGDTGQAATEFGPAGDIQMNLGAEGNFASDRGAVEDALFGRLNPQLDRQKQQLETQLQSQGIRYGSPAYTAAMDNWSRQANDLRLGVTAQGLQEQQGQMGLALSKGQFANAAQQQAFQEAQARGQFQQAGTGQRFQEAATRADYSNAALAAQLAQKQSVFNAQNMARNQYMNEQYALRNQPINEISALLSGSQINNPNFVNTPNNQIPTTDVAGLINNKFSQDLQSYQIRQQQQQAMMGGIFGLAGGLMKGAFALSDEREKKDVIRVGSILTPSSSVADIDRDELAPTRHVSEGMVGGGKVLPMYEYSYKGDPTGGRYAGPMAQDVEKVMPSAVKTVRGRKYVDQDQIGSILKVA